MNITCISKNWKAVYGVTIFWSFSCVAMEEDMIIQNNAQFPSRNITRFNSSPEGYSDKTIRSINNASKSNNGSKRPSQPSKTLKKAKKTKQRPIKTRSAEFRKKYTIDPNEQQTSSVPEYILQEYQINENWDDYDLFLQIKAAMIEYDVTTFKTLCTQKSVMQIREPDTQNSVLHMLVRMMIREKTTRSVFLQKSPKNKIALQEMYKELISLPDGNQLIYIENKLGQTPFKMLIQAGLLKQPQRTGVGSISQEDIRKWEEKYCS